MDRAGRSLKSWQSPDEDRCCAQRSFARLPDHPRCWVIGCISTETPSFRKLFHVLNRLVLAFVVTLFGSTTGWAQPLNDECVGAEPIACGDIVIGDTTIATPDTAPFCFTSDGTAGGVWYSFIGTGDEVVLTTCNAATTYDTKLRVYTGDCSVLNCVVGDDDDACTFAALRSRVTWVSDPGVEYLILVHGFSSGAGTFELSLDCFAPPVAGLVCSPALALDSDVTWTNPIPYDSIDVLVDGIVEQTLPGTDESTTVSFTAGGTYEVCVVGFVGGTPSTESCCSVDAGIDNDECTSSISVGATSTTVFDTTVATDSGIDSGCGFGGTNDIWYDLTATCDGDYTISLCAGSSYDTTLALWDGVTCPVAGDAPLDCDNDGCGTQSEIVVALLAGQTVYVQVAGFLGDVGAGTLTVTNNAAPLNDTCDTAEVITDGTYTWTNACASVSGASPGCGGGAPVDIWYEYTAACDGIMTIDTEGTPTGDTRLAVWDACPSSGGLIVECNDDGGTGLLSLIDFTVVAGTTYFIQVGGFTTGTVPAGAQLTVGCAAAPIQDLTCLADPSGDVTLSWLNPSVYDSIEVDVDGLLDQTLAGTAVDAVVSTSSGTHTICVRGIIGGVPSGDICCTVQIPGDFTGQVVVLNGEETGTGLVDSVTALTDSFDGLGITNYAVVDSLDIVGGNPEVIYCVMGTFPDDRELTVSEGDQLFDWIVNQGVPVLVSAGDLWGFTPIVTGWNEVDGVGTPVDDGADAVVQQIASDFLAADGTTPYVQDNPGNDWIDELHPVTELARNGGAPVELLRPANAAGVAIPADSGPDFLTALVYTDDDGTTTIAMSTEIGGYNGGGAVEVQAFVGSLHQALTGGSTGGGNTFSRGDCNDDGGFDISDAVTSLSALFVFGSPTPPCLDACDTNDDGGFDISDPVFSLSSLFVMGSVPPAPPTFPACGGDPTPADGLDCASDPTTACP